MQNKKFSEALNGKGYYIALILCAIAIGISGYLYYQNVSEVVDPSDVPAINTDGNHRPGETLPDPTTNPTTPTNPKKGLKATVSPLTGEKVVDYAIPGTDVQHRLIFIKKIKETPKKYPRAFAKIKKNPL